MTGRDRETLRYPVDHGVGPERLVDPREDHNCHNPIIFWDRILCTFFKSRPLSIPVDGGSKTKDIENLTEVKECVSIAQLVLSARLCWSIKVASDCDARLRLAIGSEPSQIWLSSMPMQVQCQWRQRQHQFNPCLARCLESKSYYRPSLI